jgi:hypothetical protein
MVWRMTLNKFESRFAIGSSTYILIVLVGALAGFTYQFRTKSIFSCQADGYSTDRYLAACNAALYGDYDHGAFWFDLEPAAQSFAKNADVLFLGSSRMQLAFSTAATADWFTAASADSFAAASARYYLLGFADYANMIMADAMLRKIQPRAKVYVINVDDFFETSETPSVKKILHDPKAREQYQEKRLLQRVHEPICKTVPAVCGNNFAVFRSRETGAFAYAYKWQRGSPYRDASAPVSYDQVVNRETLERNTGNAVEFLSRLPLPRECVILTMVPTVGTKIGNATALATALGVNLVTPEVASELRTLDGSHLDRPSAERWSQAFLQVAAPRIRPCL